MSAFVRSEDQRLLASEVRRVLAAERPFKPRRAAAPPDDDFWAEASALGWPAALFPEDAGGIGGLEEAAILAEEFGRAARPEPADVIGAIAHALLAQPATPAREALIAEILDGRTRSALADQPTLRAEPAGGGWRLSGHLDVSLGAVGATETLAAAGAAQGLIAARIAHDQPGVALRLSPTFDGRAVAALDLEGVFVASDHVFEHAASLFGDARAAFLVLSGATAVGAMERAVELAADYIKTRKQFGVAIGSFQALRHALADAQVELELARSMLALGIETLIEPGDHRERTVSAVKARIGEAALAVGARAVQLHGGVGMTEDFEVGWHYRRLLAFDLTAGSRAYHLQRFAELGAG